MPHEDALRNVQLFSQLASKDLGRLGRAVVERNYKKGETIMKEGEQAVAFFIITSGKVEVSQSVGSKKSQTLDTLGPSAYVGEMALIDGGPRAATVKALEDTTCLVLSRWDFVAELQTSPHMAVAMLPVLVRRLREVEAKLAATH
ncbi:MAG: cyclic nucleotide-binding domain-containing protein [Chloroflexota bacterium]|nr:cyclic nucleotide-binding domain-containing protein [Chloroflexota bacterium]